MGEILTENKEIVKLLMNLLVMSIGAALTVLLKTLVAWLKERHLLDDEIDKQVKIAEATFGGVLTGSIKKRHVLNSIGNFMQDEGISIGARFILGRFGGINKSIDKAAKRFFK